MWGKISFLWQSRRLSKCAWDLTGFPGCRKVLRKLGSVLNLLPGLILIVHSTCFCPESPCKQPCDPASSRTSSKGPWWGRSVCVHVAAPPWPFLRPRDKNKSSEFCQGQPFHSTPGFKVTSEQKDHQEPSTFGICQQNTPRYLKPELVCFPLHCTGCQRKPRGGITGGQGEVEQSGGRVPETSSDSWQSPSRCCPPLHRAHNLQGHSSAC